VCVCVFVCVSLCVCLCVCVCVRVSCVHMYTHAHAGTFVLFVCLLASCSIDIGPFCGYLVCGSLL